MAGPAETIREFLVALGFKTDERALKKFTESIDKATKRVFTLAAAIEATATTIALGVARWASNLEQLYFASLRTGSTVANLKALDRAAQNFGTTAGEALDSIEGIAEALRKNPGNEGLLVGLGVQIKKSKEGIVDTGDALLQLSKVFQNQPLYLSEQYASLLGINEKTLLAMRNGDFVREFQRIRKELASTDWKKASEDSHRFMTSMRDLLIVVEAFGVKVEDALQKRLGLSVKGLRDWIEKNGDWLANRIIEVSISIIHAAEWIGSKIGWLIDKLKEWDKETDGLSTKLVAIAILLKATGAGSIIGGILSFGGALLGLGGTLAPVVATLTAIAASITAIAAAVRFLKGQDAGNWISDLANKGAGKLTGDSSIGGWLADKVSQFKKWSQTPLGIRSNNPGNLEFAGQAGASRMGRFATFRTPAEGLLALANQLELDASRGLNSVGSLLKKYAPAGENNLPAYIADVSKRLQVAANQRLDLGDPVVLNRLMGAIISHENRNQNPYSFDQLDYAAGRAIALHQKTDIHVYSSDPIESADRVSKAQKGVNSDLARNLSTAVQ